jgi:hypothetical protein
MNTRILLLITLSLGLMSAGRRPADLPFEKHLLDGGAAETAATCDVNGDGRLDIVSGEYWYEGPSWKKHQFRELPYDNFYIDAFSDLPMDVDGDGKVDIVSAVWFGKKLSWYKNTGKAGGMWPETIIDQSGNIEFAFQVDLNNDGKALEILPQYGGKVHTAWFELVGGKFVKHLVSPDNFGHGIGAGDLNGDGKADVLTPKGWLEAKGGDQYAFHPFPALKNSTSFMHVLDVNGDGRNDVVTGYAHDYGVFWLEQKADGTFVERMIDDSWSQPHAITMVDLNKDGRMDFLTGKRYMAHNGKDPGEREALGVYWYEFSKEPSGKIQWTKHVVDYSTRTGAGMQLAVADLDKDGDLDFVAPGKSGLYLFEGLTNAAKR